MEHGLTKKWTGPYRKTGKHRKRCQVCGKLVQDGERAVMGVFKSTGYYPVKGTMGFRKFYVQHAEHASGWAAE